MEVPKKPQSSPAVMVIPLDVMGVSEAEEADERLCVPWDRQAIARSQHEAEAEGDTLHYDRVDVQT